MHVCCPQEPVGVSNLSDSLCDLNLGVVPSGAGWHWISTLVYVVYHGVFHKTFVGWLGCCAGGSWFQAADSGRRPDEGQWRSYRGNRAVGLGMYVDEGQSGWYWCRLWGELGSQFGMGWVGGRIRQLPQAGV